MVIEFERLNTAIVNHNLSLSEEPVAETRGDDAGSGFITECYLGPRTYRDGSI